MGLATIFRSPRHPTLGPPRLLLLSRHPSYFRATRHPLPCLLFLLPLLIAYEVGVIRLGGDHAERIRNGADTWLRWTLEAFGFQQLYLAPALLVAGLLAWCWLRRWDRPGDLVGVVSGMVLESVVYAVLLWRLSKELGPLLERLGVVLADGPKHETALAQLLSFVGAGIYEEALFRLALFGGLLGLLRLIGVSRLIALALAALAAALAFAVVHHLGPYGEPVQGYAFLFRTAAGIYFTALLLFLGFGIAVGAHVCYDVIVGMAVG
jgi:hypothetical protein